MLDIYMYIYINFCLYIYYNFIYKTAHLLVLLKAREYCEHQNKIIGVGGICEWESSSQNYNY